MASEPSGPLGKAIDAARDMVAEPAKATQETAKAASKAIDLVRDAGSLFGDAASEFAAMLGEQMRYWRFRNLDRLIRKVERLRDEQKISPETIKLLPFGTAARVIEAASMEEDDTVQELWARLLNNSTNSAENVDISKIYIELIKDLSASEVQFLDFLWLGERNLEFKTVEEVRKFNFSFNEMAENTWRKYDLATKNTSIQNLVRMRCITFRTKPVDLSYLFQVVELPDRRATKIYSMDPKKFERIIAQMLEMIHVASGVKGYDALGPLLLHYRGGFGMSAARIEVPEFNFMLTPLGNSLMRACAQPSTKVDVRESPGHQSSEPE